MIFLLELDYHNRVNGLEETVYLTTERHFSYEGRVYQPALKVGLSFEEFLYGRGSTSGEASSSVGDITIPNSDGAFDYLDKATFNGRQFRTYWVDPEKPTVLNTYVTGTVKYTEFTMEELTFKVTDVLETLEFTFLKNKFLGTNSGMGAAGGLEGGEEDLKGQNKPRLYGRCRNIQPFLINAFHLIYACNYDSSGNRAPVHSFWNVYGKGAEYLYEGDVATTELLIAASVSPSYYKTCVAEGTFRLGTVPNGEVTCDVMESFGEDSSCARVIGRILAETPAVSIDGDSLERMHEEFKCPVGLFVTGEQTVTELVKELLASVEIWVVPDYSGVLKFGRNSDPLTAPKHVIDGNSAFLKSLQKVNTSDNSKNVPKYSVTLGHTRNWKVLEKGALIEAIPEESLGFSSLREFFSTEYRYSTIEDQSIIDLDPSSSALAVDTLLQSPVQAKLRNSSFYEDFSIEEPFDWALYQLGTGGDASITDGICTITAGTLDTYIQQTLASPDEIYPGEYTLEYSIVSGNSQVLITDGGGTLVSEPLTAVNGICSVTFTFTTSPLIVSIGPVSGTLELASVNLSESDSLGTPLQEAQRRFAIRSLKEDRYKMSLPFSSALDFRLGDKVLFKLNRFDLEEGEVFMVIGRALDLPSIDVEIDLWRYVSGD